MAARSLAQAIFGGKPIDPKEQAKSWRLKIKGEMRQLERQITKMSQDEQKILKEIKKAAKDGQMGGAKILAKAVAFSRKGKERLLIAKINLNTIDMKIAEQHAMMRVGASFEKSVEIMKLMNQAVRHEAVRDTMQELAKEMQKAELFDELVDEAFADMDSEDVEAESEGQVEQIMAELGLELAGALPAAAAGAPARVNPATSADKTTEAPVAVQEDEEEGLGDMQARIAALRAA